MPPTRRTRAGATNTRSGGSARSGRRVIPARDPVQIPEEGRTNEVNIVPSEEVKERNEGALQAFKPMDGIDQAGYEKFTVFQILYETARRSTNFYFRTVVSRTLEKLIPDYPTRADQWGQHWGSAGKYFHIRADRIQNLKIDLQRLRWYEELGQVGLFMFIPTKRPDTWITRDGKKMTQNQWVYNQAMKYIRPERVALYNRFYSRLNDPNHELGLSKQPDRYWILEFLAEPPRFTIMEATVFHHFVPKRSLPNV